MNAPEPTFAPVPPASDDLVSAVEALGERLRQVRERVGRIIFGQTQVIDNSLITLLGGGHALLIGVPGLAKTRLVETLGTVFGLEGKRVQFTPDLMPADILGSEVLEESETGQRAFRFIRGPVFCQLLMADEINRASPRTQSALLQAMQERRVTAGGRTYPLDPPFLVFATQNPIEQEGTYPLPEAQLDRFMFMVDVGYPTEQEEVEVVLRTTGAAPQPLQTVLGPDEILALQELVLRVPVAEDTVRYAVGLVRRTRPKEADAPAFVRQYLAWGAGPRASQYLILAAKARAVLHGRYAAEREDVRALAMPVLRHRMLPNFTAEAEGVDSASIVRRLLELVR